MNDFLPTGYEAPQGNYMKFKPGKNHFRVVGSAIVGWEYWTTDNKPVRSKELWEVTPKDAKLDKDGLFVPKFFWAFPVYNYDAKKVQILEVTQTRIRKDIEALLTDSAWGSPKDYDLVITATGEGLNREYTVMPKPHTPEPIKEIPNINMEALFAGDDPFKYDPARNTTQSVEG